MCKDVTWMTLVRLVLEYPCARGVGAPLVFAAKYEVVDERRPVFLSLDAPRPLTLCICNYFHVLGSQAVHLQVQPPGAEVRHATSSDGAHFPT